MIANFCGEKAAIRAEDNCLKAAAAKGRFLPKIILTLAKKIFSTYQLSLDHVIVTDSGKHGMTASSAECSAELFSKTSEMLPNGLNIPMYES